MIDRVVVLRLSRDLALLLYPTRMDTETNHLQRPRHA